MGKVNAERHAHFSYFELRLAAKYYFLVKVLISFGLFVLLKKSGNNGQSNIYTCGETVQNFKGIQYFLIDDVHHETPFFFKNRIRRFAVNGLILNFFMKISQDTFEII